MPALDMGFRLRGAPYPEIQDPVRYGSWMWIVALAILVLVVAWYVWVAWWVRRRDRRSQDTTPQPVTGSALDRLRAAYLGRIETARASFDAGETDLRGFHLELNALLRDFAHERGGIDARALTVREIERLASGSVLAATLRRFIEPTFARRPEARADAATDAARGVVAQW